MDWHGRSSDYSGILLKKDAVESAARGCGQSIIFNNFAVMYTESQLGP